MSKAGLKAGLIGGGIVAVLQLLGLIPIPCLGCFLCLAILAVYVGAGVLAAFWLPIPRSAGDGAGAGAIAGVVAGIIGGVLGMIVSAIQFAITGGGATIMSQIPQESLDALRDAGVDPNMFTSIGAVLGVGALCCVGSMVIAAALGAVGGGVFAAMQSD
jgi:hypothetical protein